MYIEFVIADNFLLTYLAGATAISLTHGKRNVWRLLIASTAGTAVAVFYPYIHNIAVRAAVKLCLGTALCAILFYKTKRPLASSLMFLGSTFMYGGACYALGFMIFADSAAAYEFSGRCPLFVVLGIGAVVFLSGRYVAGRLRIARAKAPYEYGTDIEIYGTSLHFEAFVDTGNCVFDDVTGLPVIITGTDMFSEKLNAAAAREFVLALDGLRSITVSTPAGCAKAYVVKPTGITVYSDRRSHKIDAVIGLVGAFDGAHELLLNPAVMTEGI